MGRNNPERAWYRADCEWFSPGSMAKEKPKRRDREDPEWRNGGRKREGAKSSGPGWGGKQPPKEGPKAPKKR